MKCELIREPTYIHFHKITEIIVVDIDNYRDMDSPNALVKTTDGKTYLVNGKNINVGDYMSYDMMIDAYSVKSLDDIKSNQKLRIIEE